MADKQKPITPTALIRQLKKLLAETKADPTASPLDVLTVEQRLSDAREWKRIRIETRKAQRSALLSGQPIPPEMQTPSDLSVLEIQEHILNARKRAMRQLGMLK